MAVPAWISEAGVLGTWIIAAAAIWGEKIRSSLFRPKLEAELLSKQGEKIPLNVPGENRTIDGRYFHLRVRNQRRTFPTAHGVQVVITKIDKRDSDGRPITQFAGMVPVTWRHPEIHPLTLDIGPERHADLFYLSKDGYLRFSPVLLVNNFPREQSGETKIWVTAIARATECDSEPIRLEIDWDGEFPGEDSEVEKHLKIARVQNDEAI